MKLIIQKPVTVEIIVQRNTDPSILTEFYCFECLALTQMLSQGICRPTFCPASLLKVSPCLLFLRPIQHTEFALDPAKPVDECNHSD